MDADEGRSEAFDAASGILPRIAKFISTLPTDAHSTTWLSKLISDFARACRDPGLIRDVASILTEALAPDAPAQADMLNALANVDDTESPELVLARMDPDIAIWIRQIRESSPQNLLQ